MRRAQRRKYHFIYKTTCIVTGRYYYGMHSTDNLDDGYIGSGKRLWYSINKHGKENHICEKIEFLKSRKALKEREAEIVNENLLKDFLCMNLQLGGGGGFIDSNHAKKFHIAGAIAVRKIINKRNSERLKTDEEYRKKCLANLKNGFRENNAFFGKHHTGESKIQMGEKIKIKQSGGLNSQYGTCWITNKTQNKKIKKGEIIPEGWELGRKLKMPA